MIKVYSLKWAPPVVRGYVRDIRVRWALEEAGLKYENPTVTFEDKKKDDYLKLQPFGQVPAYEEGDLRLSETGGIVHHIALKSEALMPKDADEQARVTSWMFAALNSMEHATEAWLWGIYFDKLEKDAKARAPIMDFLDSRLDHLVKKLDGREYLTSKFSAADLLMGSVLNFLRDEEPITKRPVLFDYRARMLARPAAKKAFADHFASFDESAAPKSMLG